MTARFFVDTNVLLYAYDRAEPDKQIKSLALLNYLTSNELAALSTQVLGEFFATAIRKLRVPLSVNDASLQVAIFLQSFEIVNLTGAIVLEAARGVRDYQFSFWDAQIWAAAKLNQIPVVLTEDFNIGASIEGVRFVNPFEPEFRLEDWLR
ncbi:MAG TPA: PIN domain-containing protein [Chloroflexia bacterium]|jgi:predicted nucleic acid-binding protein